MKTKNLFLILVLIAFLLCSCGAPTETESETQASAVTETTPEDTKEPDETQLLFELADSLLPPMDFSRDALPEQKISAEVYEGTVFDGGKYLIYLHRTDLPNDLPETAMREFRKQYGHSVERLEAVEAVHTAYNTRFAARYVTDLSDVLYMGSYTSSFVLYATEEEILKYASCPEVTAILSGDDFLYPSVNDEAPQTAAHGHWVNAVETYRNSFNTLEADTALLYRLADEFLPEENTAPDPEWEQKIAPDIYTADVDENGKYKVHIFRSSLSQNAAGKLYVAFQKQTGYFIDVAYARDAVRQRYFDRFAGRYIDDPADVIYENSLTGSIILYATDEDLEKYARSQEVLSIHPHINIKLSTPSLTSTPEEEQAIIEILEALKSNQE